MSVAALNHRAFTNGQLHAAGYFQATDPTLDAGADVRDGQVWFKKVGSPPYAQFIWRAAGAAWEQVGLSATAPASYLSIQKTTLPAATAVTVASGEQAVVYGTYTILGTLTVLGEFRVLAWPA